jgi:hypothetical protein
MTDGIIQKVFTQYPSKTLFKQIDDNFSREYANMIMDYISQDYIRIRRELIEEIKKRVIEDLGQIDRDTYIEIPLEELIGDNE